MKTSEFRKLIREEVQNILSESTLNEDVNIPSMNYDKLSKFLKILGTKDGNFPYGRIATSQVRTYLAKIKIMEKILMRGPDKFNKNSSEYQSLYNFMLESFISDDVSGEGPSASNAQLKQLDKIIDFGYSVFNGYDAMLSWWKRFVEYLKNAQVSNDKIVYKGKTVIQLNKQYKYKFES